MAIYRGNSNPIPSLPPSNGDWRGPGGPANPNDTPGGPENPDDFLPAVVVAGVLTSALTAVGSVATFTPSTWTNEPVVTRQWMRNGVALAGIVGLEYVFALEDQGKAITVEESAINVSGLIKQVSNAITVTAGGTLPVIVSNPFITANANPIVAGVVLTGQTGSYTGQTSVTRKWTRDSFDIAGATGFTYTVNGSLDIGAAINYVELPTNAQGSVEALSTPVVPQTSVPTEPDLVQTLNFSAGVNPNLSVIRGTPGATYRDVTGKIKEAAPHTVRYTWSAVTGSLLGFYMERSKTNVMSHSKAVGDPSVFTKGTGVTVTLNAATSPSGDSDATRVQIDAGTALRGISRGIAVPVGSLRSTIYIRNRGAGSVDLTLRDPASGYSTVSVGTVWTKIEFRSINEGAWFNWMIFSQDGNAKDIEVWGLDLTSGGDEKDSIIQTGTGGAQTRNVEIMQVVTSTNGTKDVVLVMSNGDRVKLFNQTFQGNTLSISADSIPTSTTRIVAGMEIWAVGKIPGSGSPPPPPPPPPADGTNLGNFVIVGDSLHRGNGSDVPTRFYSPAKSLVDKLNAGGYTFTMKGNYSAYPGNIPVQSVGGRKITQITSDVPNISALNPKTILISIGTNDLGSVYANVAADITACLNALEAIPTVTAVIVASPPKLSWFNNTSYNNYYDAVVAWVTAQPSKRFLTNLTDAPNFNVSGSDGNGDGTHWSEQGAEKVAVMEYSRIVAAFGGGGGTIPPPPAGDGGPVWTSAQVEEAIIQATGLNEAPLKGVTRTSGWAIGSALGMGNRWNSAAPMPSGWSWPTGPWDVNMYWSYIYPWGVIFNRNDNTTGDGWAEIRNFEVQLLYRDATSWTRIIAKNNNVGWGELFKADNVTSSGVLITSRVNSSGTNSIRVPLVNHPHFTMGGSGTKVSNLGNIEGVLITCEVRIDPNGDQNVKALIDVALDPKPTTGGNKADGVPWYPGTQVSAAINITSQWRRVTSCNIYGIAADSTQTPRTMTKARFRAVPPLS